MTKAGARNPKVAQFSIRLDDKINTRLEAVADAAGANKGTMAAMAVAAGLNLLEQIYGTAGMAQHVQELAQEKSMELMHKTAEDMQRAAEVQTPRPVRDKFKLELEQPRSEWTGYMSGL